MDIVDFVLVDQMPGGTPDLGRVAAALAKQARVHLARPRPAGWGVAANVRAATRRNPPRPTDVQIVLTDQIDMDDALGYHSVSPAGLPIVKVFPALEAADGVHWSVTASHEICETAINPDLVLCAQDPRGVLWALESSDAVQADVYDIDGVLVSDFVLPWYFGPPADPRGAVGKMDHLGRVTAPYEIRPGGYGQWWHPSRGWSSAFAAGVRPALRDRALRGRRALRQAALDRSRLPSAAGRVALAMTARFAPAPPPVDASGGIPGVPLDAFASRPGLPDPGAMPPPGSAGP